MSGFASGIIAIMDRAKADAERLEQDAESDAARAIDLLQSDIAAEREMAMDDAEAAVTLAQAAPVQEEITPLFGARKGTALGVAAQAVEYPIAMMAGAGEAAVDPILALGSGLLYRWPKFLATGESEEAPRLAEIADFFTGDAYSKEKQEALDNVEGSLVRGVRKVAEEAFGLWASFGAAGMGSGVVGKVVGAPGTFVDRVTRKIAATPAVAAATTRITTGIAGKLGMAKETIASAIDTGTLGRLVMAEAAKKGAMAKVSTWLATNAPHGAAVGMGFGLLEAASGEPGVADPAAHLAITTAMGPAFLALGRLATRAEHAIAARGADAAVAKQVRGFVAGTEKWTPAMAPFVAGTLEGFGFATLLSPRESLDFLKAVYHGDGDAIGDHVVRILGSGLGMGLLRGYRPDPDLLREHRRDFPEDRVRRFPDLPRDVEDAAARLQLSGYTATREGDGPVILRRPGVKQEIRLAPDAAEGTRKELETQESRALDDLATLRTADFGHETFEIRPGVVRVGTAEYTFVDGTLRARRADAENAAWQTVPAEQWPMHFQRRAARAEPPTDAVEQALAAEFQRVAAADVDGRLARLEDVFRRGAVEDPGGVLGLLRDFFPPGRPVEPADAAAVWRASLGLTSAGFEAALYRAQLSRGGAEAGLRDAARGSRADAAEAFSEATLARMTPRERREAATAWAREHRGRTGEEVRAEDLTLFKLSPRAARRAAREGGRVGGEMPPSSPPTTSERRGKGRHREPQPPGDPAAEYGFSGPEWEAGVPGTEPIRRRDVELELRGRPTDPVQVRPSEASSLGGGNVEGYFAALPNTTRILHGRLAVQAHEWAHAFEDRLARKLGDRWQELLPPELDAEGARMAEYYGPGLAELPEGRRRREYFAEFAARHLLGDPRVAKEAPGMVRFLEATLAAHPEFGAQYGRVADALRRWREQGSVLRGKGYVEMRGAPRSPQEVAAEGNAVQQAWRSVKRALFNDAADMLQVEAAAWAYETGRPRAEYLRQVRPSESFSKMTYALSLNAAAQFERMLLFGTHDATGKRTGPSLQEVWGDRVKPEDAHDFATYWAALKQREMLERGHQTMASKTELDQQIAGLERPGWHEVVLESVAFLHRVIAYGVEMGAWTAAEAKTFTEPRFTTIKLGPHETQSAAPMGGYRYYVPFDRIFDTEGPGGGGGTAGGQPKRLETGSQRPIRDPMEAFMSLVRGIIRRSHMAATQRALVTSWATTPGMGRVVHPHEPDAQLGVLEGERVGQEILNALAQPAPKPGTSGNVFTVALKWTEPQLAEMEARALSRHEGDTAAQGYVREQFRYLRDINGKTSAWSVDAKLYDTITGASDGFSPRAELLNAAWFKKVGSVASRLVKLGATGLSLPFQVRNIWRDSLAYGTYTAKPKNLLTSWMSGLFEMGRAWHELRKGHTDAELFKALGGTAGTFLRAEFVKPVERKLDVLRQTDGALGKLRRGFRRVVDILSTSEHLLRYAEFKHTRQKRLEEGWSEFDANLDALLSSKEITVDYTRAGTVARAVNNYVPFFNAAMQSQRKFFGTAFGAFGAEAQRRMLMRGTVAMGSLSVLQWLLGNGTDEFDALDDQERARNWNFFIFGERIRLPKPFELGMWFTFPLEQAMDRLSGNQAVEFKDGIHELLMTLVPPLVPAAIGPGLQVWDNRDWFRDKPIVPEWMEKHRIPAEQAHRYNTRTARWMGEALGISPAKLEHFVGQMTGGLAPGFARWAEDVISWTSGEGTRADPWRLWTAGLSDAFHSHPYRGSRQVTELYDLSRELRQRKGSKVATQREVMALRMADRLQDRLSTIRDRAEAENWTPAKTDREIHEVVAEALPDIKEMAERN